MQVKTAKSAGTTLVDQGHTSSVTLSLNAFGETVLASGTITLYFISCPVNQHASLTFHQHVGM